MREICRNLRRPAESLNRKAAEMLFIKYLSQLAMFWFGKLHLDMQMDSCIQRQSENKDGVRYFKPCSNRNEEWLVIQVRHVYITSSLIPNNTVLWLWPGSAVEPICFCSIWPD